MAHEPVEPDRRRSRRQDVPPDVAVAQPRTCCRGENEIVPRLAHEQRHNLIHDGSRHADLPPLVILGEAPDQFAADFCRGLGDREAAPHRVDVANARGCQFTPPVPAKGQRQHHSPGVPSRVGQLPYVGQRQDSALGLSRLGQLDPCGWVARYLVGSGGRLKDERRAPGGACPTVEPT